MTLRLSASADSYLETLHSSYHRSDLVMYVGAGVSVAAGAPGWDELLRRLTFRMLMREAGEVNEDPNHEEMKELFGHFRHRSPLILARYLRHYFGKDFREEIRRALYGSVSVGHTTPLLDEIARLARHSDSGSGLQSIVNYNFDDLLEQALTQLDIPFQVIAGPGYRLEPGVLPVYHVQGYLPRTEGMYPVGGSPVELVFSEEAYHNQYLNPYSWSNLTQLHLLQEHTGLFVGLSMTDRNLRRLLEASYESCNRHHYALVPTYRAEAENQSGAAASTLEQLENSPLSRALRDIEDKVAESMGLRFLWVDRFDLLPELLSRLRS